MKTEIYQLIRDSPTSTKLMKEHLTRPSQKEAILKIELISTLFTNMTDLKTQS